MTKPLPDPMRKHFDAIAAHYGATDPNCGNSGRRISELLDDLERAAFACKARFTLVAICPADIEAIQGARRCVEWAERTIKSRKKEGE